VAADERDPDAHLVEPEGVSPYDVAVDAARAALEDLAVRVDEEVVADVVPAAGEDVIRMDRSDDRGRLGRLVVDPAACVVDDDEDRTIGELRVSADDRLVREPFSAPDHGRRLNTDPPVRRHASLVRWFFFPQAAAPVKGF
jgi:hypothetical protein